MGLRALKPQLFGLVSKVNPALVDDDSAKQSQEVNQKHEVLVNCFHSAARQILECFCGWLKLSRLQQLLEKPRYIRNRGQTQILHLFACLGAHQHIQQQQVGLMWLPGATQNIQLLAETTNHHREFSGSVII